MAFINTPDQLTQAEQAYYSGTSYRGKSGDLLWNEIQKYYGCSHKSVDFSDPMGIPNKAKTGSRVDPYNINKNRY